MDTTFSDDEKRFVLGEMIKVSAVEVSTLVDFIRAHRVEPNWMSMQLPRGRNMNQCLGALDNMFQTRFPPPNLTKRKSLGDLIDHHAKRQAVVPEPQSNQARQIQPRPPPNGFPAPNPISSVPATNTTTGKKRGRPSKADKEAAAQARAVSYSRPTEYAPITPAPLAPMALQPQQREYASSPGYEIASSSTDQNLKKPARQNRIDSPGQGNVAYPLISSASVKGIPRGLPEPTEQVERANLSPRNRQDPRSPPVLPFIQQQQQDPSQPHSHAQLQTQPQPLIPLQPSPRPAQMHDYYRGPDPIFPDRDRSRSMPDQLPRDNPASPVTSRT